MESETILWLIIASAPVALVLLAIGYAFSATLSKSALMKGMLNNRGWIGTAVIVLGGLFVLSIFGWESLYLVGAFALVCYAVYRWLQAPAMSHWVHLCVAGILLFLALTPHGQDIREWTSRWVMGYISEEEQKVAEDREAVLRQARIAELQRLVDIAPLKAEEETEDALGCTPRVQIPIPADAEVRVWMRANCDLGIKFIRSLGATYTVTQYVGPDYSPNFTQVFGPDEIMDFQAFPYVRAKYYLVAAGPDTSGLIEVYRCLEHAACPALRTN